MTRLLTGELHQGALEGVMVEAVARAAGVPAAEVRRAHLLGGSLPRSPRPRWPRPRSWQPAGTGRTAPRNGNGGGADPGPARPRPDRALRRRGASCLRLQVGRPLRPMLAAAAPTVAAAFARLSPAAVEWKIDGIRIQVHRRGAEVAVFTRTLDDITIRVPEITARSWMARRNPWSWTARRSRCPGRPAAPVPGHRGPHRQSSGAPPAAPDVPLTPFFFDLLHLDGPDLSTSRPANGRRGWPRCFPRSCWVPRIVTADVAAAGEFFADTVARGTRVLVKSLSAPYAAGRRGSEWIKVKPRHTLDLVVLAAEWGHGRRRGWLSNLHLGARDPVTGGLVMLGKTSRG